MTGSYQTAHRCWIVAATGLVRALPLSLSARLKGSRIGGAMQLDAAGRS